MKDGKGNPLWLPQTQMKDGKGNPLWLPQTHPVGVEGQFPDWVLHIMRIDICRTRTITLERLRLT